MRLCRCYLTLMLALLTMAASAATPNARVEEAWGKIYITHNGRICPMSVVCCYPMADMENPAILWPEAQSEDDVFFQDRALSLLYMYLYEEDYDAAVHLLEKIRLYQEKHIDNLPSDFRMMVEQAFHRLKYTKPLAILCLTIGLVLLLLELLLVRKSEAYYWTRETLAVCLCLFLTLMLAARWYLSGHIPFGGGHETMQVMAWFALLIASLLSVTSSQTDTLFSSLGILTAGFALLVSNMAAYNPEIDELMPALQSPWLATHVSSVMLSYTLFTILTLISAIGLFKRSDIRIHLILLDVAVVFLTIGIVLGSLWAKTAWGTYWNWDPKETWALITLCIYLVAVVWGHCLIAKTPRVSPQNEKHRWWFHLYCVLAFVSVIITYFGVNFIFGGLHSYA